MLSDPVLVVAVAVAGPTAGWLITRPAADPTALRAGWSVSSACLAAVAVTCLRLVPSPGSADAWRRRWRLLAWSAAASGAAHVVQLFGVRSGTDLASWPAAALLGAGGLLALVALLRHPLPDLPRPAHRRVRLDAGTVLAAVAACWSAVTDAGRSTPGGGWSGYLGLVALLGSAYGLTRIRLAHGRLRAAAGPPLLLAVGIGTAAAASSWVGTGRAGWYLALCVVAAAAVLVQVRVALVDGAAGPGEHRPADEGRRSAVPPAALAVTFAAAAAAHLRQDGGGDAGLVSLGVAAFATALVVLRHRGTAAENEQLRERLDRAVTEREDLKGSFHRLAFEDPLTGAANRSRFEAELAAAQAEAARRGTAVALLLIDLDNFKPVNDSFGHAAGDTVLRECVARMAACLGPGDLLARIGGDEFAVVLRQAYKLAATALGERIVAELQRPITVDSTVTVQIGASVGVAASSGGRRTSEALLRDADRAMYRAKESGKGTVGIA